MRNPAGMRISIHTCGGTEVALVNAEADWTSVQLLECIPEGSRPTLHQTFFLFGRVVIDAKTTLSDIGIVDDASVTMVRCMLPRVLTSSADRTARLWDVPSSSCVHTLKGHCDEIGATAFSTDARHIITASWDSTAKVWDSESGTCLSTLRGHQGAVVECAFVPNGEGAVTTSDDGSARVWNYLDGSCSNVFQGKIDSCVFLVGRRFVLMTEGIGSGECLRDVVCGTTVGRLQMTELPSTVALSPGSHRPRLLCSMAKGVAELWDVCSGGLVQTLRGHQRTIVSAHFSPDGLFALTAAWDWTAKVWDLSAGSCVRTLCGHNAGLSCAIFSPDGRFILTASRDKTAKLWCSGLGDCVATLGGHEHTVSSLDFSSDGGFILTGSSDGSSKCWNVAGDCLRTFSEHAKRVRTVSFVSTGSPKA